MSKCTNSMQTLFDFIIIHINHFLGQSQIVKNLKHKSKPSNNNNGTITLIIKIFFKKIEYSDGVLNK